MIATYPTNSAFLKNSDRSADLQQSRRKAKEAVAAGLDCDQTPGTAFGFPEDENDDYHLGRLIYTL